MPHTPSASPKVEKRTEEAKSLNSSQDSSFDASSFEENSLEASSFEETSSFEESDEENYESSEDEGYEYTSEESSQPTTEPTEEEQASKNNAQRRNTNTLFGFTPRGPEVFVCPHGHLHLIDFSDNTLVFMTLHASPELMRMMALATILEALGLNEKNDLKENVGPQTEQKPEEGPIKVNVDTSKKEEEKSEEEEKSDEFGYSYFSM
ncbi:hypothetical protein [Legionella sp. WA2022007384]